MIALCFDIGGSKYNAGLVSREGAILDQEIGRWSALDEEAILGDLYGCAQRLMARHRDIAPAAVGATIPGLADGERGLWIEASFSGIRDFPIARRLAERYRLPVAADNDARACALAEHLFGVCQKVDDFLYVTVSNGIGSALWLGGRLHRGASMTAGELGHCVVAENGRPCGCGKRGCLEVHAAGPGISRNYLELGGAPGPDGLPLSAKEIAALARQGQQAALDTFRLEGELLGKALAFAVNLLNPARVVLGGGVSLAFDLFGLTLEKTVQSRIYQKANSALVIGSTALGYDGGLYGAAALAFTALEGGGNDVQGIS